MNEIHTPMGKRKEWEEMERKKKYQSAVFLFLLGLRLSIIAWGGRQEIQEQEDMEYVRLSLFCDVNFWKPPQWETKEGSITGEISQKTGVVIDTNVPALDADKQLSLLLVNGELPDMVSLTDSTISDSWWIL